MFAPELATHHWLQYNLGCKHRTLLKVTAMSDSTDSGNSDTPSLNNLISLREASSLSGLSAGHLRLLISRGEIWGVKLGRNWVTTAKAVQEYVAKGHRPGPKPRIPREDS